MSQHSTVLIVDDQKFGREALQVALESEGYNLVLAGSGPEALGQASDIRPDVVLLDVMMPDMNGFEVCRRLRADPRLSDVPVILVTALDDRQSRIDGIEAGADDFVSKPFDRVELRARVRTITRLNRYRRLLAERARFEWVVDHADDGYVMVDRDDHLLYANAQARRYLSLPSDGQLPAAGLFLGLASSQYRLEPQDLWSAREEHRAFVSRAPLYLVRAETVVSKALWLQVDTLDLDLQEGTSRLLRLRNVSAQVVLQRDIRTFHTLIAHKLRTPLSHILGSLQMLDDQLQMADAPEPLLGDLAAMALEGASRLHRQIEDVLQYLHAPALAAPSDEFALADLDGICQKIAGDLGLAGVDVSSSPGVAGELMALSQKALELIIRELLENSCKFHPQHAPQVTVCAEPSPAAMIRLQVSDNGLHLTAEQLAYAWQPYQQGEKDFTGEVQGMGLGLATVASLVWESGGTCRLRNREDAPGVVVELELPRASGEAKLDE